MDIAGGTHTEPHIAQICSWAALLAAFVLSWTTWVGVGDIAEYGVYRYALPVCVDGYIVTVLMAWIAPRDSKAARFARWNVYLSAGLSILTQSVYHGALVYSHTEMPWKSLIAWLAGALPPLFAALSVHFRTGVRVTESQTAPTQAMPPVAASLPPAPPAPAQTTPAYPVVSRETSPLASTTTSPAGSPVPRAVPPSPPTGPPPVVPPARPATPATVSARPATLSRPRRVVPTAASKAAQARRKPGRVNREEEERRKAAAMALLEGVGQAMSDVEIARRSGASPRTVGRYREQLAQRRAQQGRAS